MASYTELRNDKYKIYMELGYNEKRKRVRKTKIITEKSQKTLKKAIFEVEVRQQKRMIWKTLHSSNSIMKNLFPCI